MQFVPRPKIAHSRFRPPPHLQQPSTWNPSFTENVIETFKPTKDSTTAHSAVFSPTQSSPSRKSRGCFKKLQSLRSVVLAVNYNFPYYESAALIRSFYEPIFGEVMFCGDKDDAKQNLHKTPLNFKREGYQGYMCLKLAMELYPNFEGYFYSNDDVILNWWQLIDLDLNKIWLGEAFLPYENYKHHKFGKPLKADWHWWKDVDAAKLCEEAFNETEQFSRTAKGKALGMQKYMNNYYEISKGIKICYAGLSDVFYLPKQFKDAYLALSAIWGYKKVFLETAVPTILSFFMNETAKNYVHLKGEYFVKKTGYSNAYLTGRSFYEYYDFHLTFIHPIKFGNSQMAKANKMFFDRVVIPYGDLFYGYCRVDGIAKSLIEIQKQKVS